MSTIIKYTIVIIISILMMSCKYDLSFSGIKGDGNVTTTKRFEDNQFSKINVQEGLELILTQSKSTSVRVQADENLQNLIITEIKDDILYIHTEKQIGKAESRKVLVHFTNLNSIKSSSGADVRCTNTINESNLVLEASSGSFQELKIKTTNTSCSTSSGSEINLSGTTSSFEGKASSGSSIDADNLKANTCITEASSGAEIDVNCSDSINANASSGADIDFSGSPSEVSKSKSSGGSVSKSD